jgi:hypothetical protein
MNKKILLILAFVCCFICISSIIVGGGVFYNFTTTGSTTTGSTTTGSTTTGSTTTGSTTAGSTTTGSTTAGSTTTGSTTTGSTTAGSTTTGSTTAASTATGSTTAASTQINTNGCMNNWKYSYDNYNKLETINGCTEINSVGKPWCMLPAYVVGGRENVAWKYTNDINDPDCLTNWSFYDGSGNVVKDGINISRTITWDSGSDNTNRWCPLKTYISQGDSKPLENKSWKYC